MRARTDKRQDEAANAEAVKQFLARGGTITRLDPGPLEFSAAPKRVRRPFVRSTAAPEADAPAAPATK